MLIQDNKLLVDEVAKRRITSGPVKRAVYYEVAGRLGWDVTLQDGALQG